MLVIQCARKKSSNIRVLEDLSKEASSRLHFARLKEVEKKLYFSVSIYALVTFLGLEGLLFVGSVTASEQATIHCEQRIYERFKCDDEYSYVFEK